MYKFCIDICHGILIVVISHVSQRVASVLRARMRLLSFVSAVSLSANSQIEKQQQASRGKLPAVFRDSRFKLVITTY